MKPIDKNQIYISVLVGVLILLTPMPSGGQEYVIDQSNDQFVPDLLLVIPDFTPLGQEFTPTFEGIDFVELYIAEFQPSTCTLSAQVRIRRKTIDGVIVAESENVSVPDGFPGPLLFPIEPRAMLEPDTLYVIEILSTGDCSVDLGMSGAYFNQYPGGRMIENGTPVEDRDIWFREGMTGITPIWQTSWGQLKESMVIKEGQWE